MPRQRLQGERAPYTQVLSALRKMDLLRLCIEFNLPVEGSVVALRNRLKDYLNINRDALYRDPRYNALFPRHRRINQRPPSPAPPSESHTVSSRSSTILSYVRTASPASDASYDSWNGFANQPIPPQNPPPPIQAPVDAFQDHQPFFLPPPSPSVFIPDRNSPFPVVQAVDRRKSPLSYYLGSSPPIRAYLPYYLIRDTMQSVISCVDITMSRFGYLIIPYLSKRHYVARETL
jgi:hypothetical protein